MPCFNCEHILREYDSYYCRRFPSKIKESKYHDGSVGEYIERFKVSPNDVCGEYKLGGGK